MMNVVVFGSTGGTGRATVERLLAADHEVAAFARNPDALHLHHDRLQVVQGDVMDPVAVRRAVARRDAVVVALGVSTSPVLARLGLATNTAKNVCAQGTQNVVAAMKLEGVRRLVCVTAWGVGDSRHKVPWFFKLFLWLFLQERFADKERQEEAVRTSGLDWVIVRPAGLGNGPPKGDYFVSTEGVIRGPLIPRADVADLISRLLTEDRCLGKTVALSG